MKSIYRVFLLFTILTCFNVHANAQDNINYFAEEGTIWDIGSFSSYMPVFPTSMIFLKLEGDTIINNKNYHILWTLPCEIQGQNDTVLKLFTRVDDNLKQWLRTPSGVEYKIFDYSLELGETFNGSAYFGGIIAINAIVVEVGTIELYGETRKYWGLGNEDHTEPITRWIEGIGPLESILDVNIFFTDNCGAFKEVLCAWNNEEQIYDNEDFYKCEYYMPRYYNKINLFANYRTIFKTLTTDLEGRVKYCDWIKIDYNTSHDTEYGPSFDYYYMLWINRIPNIDSYYSPDLLIKCWEDSLLYMGPMGNSNNLVFDFKSKLGDTLNLKSYSYQNNTFIDVTGTISDVGNITTLGGIERKFWEISNENGSTKWIYGLGNSEGILNPNWNLTDNGTLKNDLLCAWNDDVQIYDNPDFDSCTYAIFNENDTIPIEPEDSLSSKFNIYPNPVTNTFTLSMEESFYTVYIYNSFGSEVLRLESDEAECQICLTGFSNGVYYLRIETENGIIKKTIVKI